MMHDLVLITLNWLFKNLGRYRYGPKSSGVGKVMKLSFQPYKVLLKRTPYVAMASFLVQTISGIREGNEVQVVDESDFNMYTSDAAMSSSSSPY